MNFAEMSEVQEYELDTLQRVADLALIPPKLNTTPLPEFDYDRLDYAMNLGIARTPEGRIWAAWVAGGDSPDAFFVLASSDDSGETWSKPRLVVNGHSVRMPLPRRILVGNLWTDPLGRLWLFFDQSLQMRDGREGLWGVLCENPDGESPEWSKPRRLWHGHALNKPLVQPSGEWMLAVSLFQGRGHRPFHELFKELDPLRGVNILVSNDEGKHWEIRGRVKFPSPCWHEPILIRRNDGSLWLWSRTTSAPHSIAQSFSQDDGRTWSEPSFLETISHPTARFFVTRLASGRLLLVKHGDTIDTYDTSAKWGRSRLSAWLSEDDGATWQGGLMLDEREMVSYPDGFQAPDGTLFISYDRNRDTDGEIWMARFTEEEALAGKLFHPQSKLRIPMVRTPRKS